MTAWNRHMGILVEKEYESSRQNFKAMGGAAKGIIHFHVFNSGAK